MSDKLFIPSKYCTSEENAQIADHLDFNRRHGMEGMVSVLHMRKDGFREILPPTHNHIVLTGRRWVMQAVTKRAFSSSIDQKNWTIEWFGVGSGGALASSPNVPLDTSDTVTGLSKILDIKPTTIPTGKEHLYTTSTGTHRKRIKCSNTSPYDSEISMSYNSSTSEVMMLLNLELDYDDCPYDNTQASVSINELGLYAASTKETNSVSTLLFSRYTRPTIYKTSGDAYLFMWYIYF